jgi:cyclopropane fatty-acyl-phospholipid synthase-like methyltransferase
LTSRTLGPKACGNLHTPETGFHAARFPRTSKYHPEWIRASISGGANSLWLAEWLAERLELKPGMQVLDLGCGRGASSIFLNREFGVRVWATDLWFSASERLQRIQDAGVAGEVFPIHADARALPFANEFFDAVVSIDSFMYYGTDDCYLGYLARFLKPGAVLGMAQSGLVQEFGSEVPEHLGEWWEPGNCCLHSAEWWRNHWEHSGILDVCLAEIMPDGWELWRKWQQATFPDNQAELRALEADRGRYLGYVRVIGRRRAEARLYEPVTAIPSQYVRKPLLRADV